MYAMQMFFGGLIFSFGKLVFVSFFFNFSVYQDVSGDISNPWSKASGFTTPIDLVIYYFHRRKLESRCPIYVFMLFAVILLIKYSLRH